MPRSLLRGYLLRLHNSHHVPPTLRLKAAVCCSEVPRLEEHFSQLPVRLLEQLSESELDPAACLVLTVLS